MSDEFNNFIDSLTANVSSKSQSRTLLSRKMRERETILQKIRNQKKQIKHPVRALQLEMVHIEGIQKEVQDLTTNINAAVDEDV